MKTFKLAGISLLIACGTTSAFAANIDDNAVFKGVIPESCTIQILTEGTLAASIDQATLSSQETGGTPATATITTNTSNSSVKVVAPTAFDFAPSGSDTNTTFSANYTLAGTTIAANVNGAVETDLNFGVAAMTVNAAATKSSGAYSGGQYEMTAIVRCVVD